MRLYFPSFVLTFLIGSILAEHVALLEKRQQRATRAGRENCNEIESWVVAFLKEAPDSRTKLSAARLAFLAPRLVRVTGAFGQARSICGKPLYKRKPRTAEQQQQQTLQRQNAEIRARSHNQVVYTGPPQSQFIAPPPPPPTASYAVVEQPDGNLCVAKQCHDELKRRRHLLETGASTTVGSVSVAVIRQGPKNGVSGSSKKFEDRHLGGVVNLASVMNQ